MGVYINMEMPKDGDKLYMIAFSDGKACASYKPFEWHEVVPVPKHGRLIDADVLAKLEVIPSDNWVFRAIEKAPTIIPASFENLPKNERYSQDNPAEDGET